MTLCYNSIQIQIKYYSHQHVRNLTKNSKQKLVKFTITEFPYSNLINVKSALNKFGDKFFSHNQNQIKILN